MRAHQKLQCSYAALRWNAPKTYLLQVHAQIRCPRQDHVRISVRDGEVVSDQELGVLRLRHESDIRAGAQAGWVAVVAAVKAAPGYVVEASYRKHATRTSTVSFKYLYFVFRCDTECVFTCSCSAGLKRGAHDMWSSAPVQDSADCTR